MSKRVEVTSIPSAYTDDRYVDDKRRVSSWLITVNPNKTYENREQAALIISRLLAATSKIFGREDGEEGEFLEDVLIWKEPPETDDWTVEIVRKPEIGKIQGRVHIHVYVTIRHTGKLQLNYKRVQRLYREFLRPIDGPYAVRDPEDKRAPLYEQLGITGIYIDIKFVPTGEGALRYLEKGERIFEKEPQDETLAFEEKDSTVDTITAGVAGFNIGKQVEQTPEPQSPPDIKKKKKK
jgi:hypothetical protein